MADSIEHLNAERVKKYSQMIADAEGLDIDSVLSVAIKKFNLNNYHGCRDLSLAGWQHEFKRRRALFNPEKKPAKGARDYGFFMIRLAKLIDSPIVNFVDSRAEPRNIVRDMCALEAWEAKAIIMEHAPKIADACAIQLGECETREYREYIDADVNSRFELALQAVTGPDYEAHMEMIFESYNDATCMVDHGQAFVAVDLSAPDKVILEKFKEWLKETRTKDFIDQCPVKGFTDTDMRGWVANKVLPYLDLKIFHALSGTTITDPQMGEILFPGIHGISLADKIRKTTRPEAERLISDAYLGAMLLASGAGVGNK